MTNEQRAHDLTLLITEYAMKNPQTITDGTVSNDGKGSFNLDIYKFYKEHYIQILEDFNRDF